MGHKYGNFADAYADLTPKFAIVKTNIENAGSEAQYALDEWDCECGGASIQRLKNAITGLRAAFTGLLDLSESAFDRSHFFESIYWAAQSGDGYELTAKKICEAWAVDDFDFAPVTIAFIDRMRQLIWDEPFFAVWAGKPEGKY